MQAALPLLHVRHAQQRPLRHVLSTRRLIGHTQHEFHIVTCKDTYGPKPTQTLFVDHGEA